MENRIRPSVRNNVYAITHHARERYLQRFLKKKKYLHLTQCKLRCAECACLSWDLREESKKCMAELNREISSRIDQSTEERSFLNNSQFMHRQFERYGYDTKFAFLRHEDAIFVGIIKPGKMVIATILPIEMTVLGNLKHREKYKKRKTIL